ncbi:M64 family metallopeptidase [Chitinimonas koreensis]|uniref:M64 family metallopeptidase n=1 Tax=Chitinimonas koreensis TaxID=356302 RepID=UPI0003F62013|nr:M64 family metallopeptidase [Chitinimonas koreensis]
MTRTLPLLVGLALTSLAASAADGNLLLRIKQNNTRGASDYELVHAQSGKFAASAGAVDSNGATIELVGRDRNGRELFRSKVNNPGTLHAEAFDPKSGKIAQAQDIVLPQAFFEVSVPDDKALDHIELSSRATTDMRGMALQPATLKRIDRAAIDGQLSRSKMMTATRAAAGTAVLYNSGPSASRMDIVLIGDGYTSGEMSKWAADAQKVANGLLADPLFNANKNNLNIRRVDVVSNQTGVDEPDKGIYRDTALGVQIGCYNIDRLVCADDNLVYSTVGTVTAADARDVIVVVANSTRYGGAGGSIATMTMHSSAIELALHEIGHTAFKLADEYDYGTCDASREPTEANVTRQTGRSGTKWGSLIPSNVQVPTPNNYYPNGTIGLFTGARYCTSGMYRPTENSRMRTLGQPWHAVNERRANAVFATYNTGGGSSTPVTVTGSLANKQWVSLPSAGAYNSTQGGTFKLQLTGPGNADFELTLYKWNGSAWAKAAESTGPTSTESINYAGSAGYYYFEVKSYSGAGNYSVTYTFPK